MRLQTLHCTAGHQWQRAAGKGRPPHSCPEHATKALRPSEANRLASGAGEADSIKSSGAIAHVELEELLSHFPDCRCGITIQTTAQELRAMKGCRDPEYICSCLDNIRRKALIA